MNPRVLFVSKPVAPPWTDGSKNLVRDIARSLTKARPTVMTLPGSDELGPRVICEPVYREAGRFSPTLAQNARVLARLMRGDAHDIWHFVFAPNAASSTAANAAIRFRRALGWRGGVVQTIASAPASFEGIERWLFGDAVVVLSEWMRGRLLGAGVSAKKLHVIHPCAERPKAPTKDERARMRALLRVGDGPIVLYPGDLEVSRGAATVVAAMRHVLRSHHDVTFVMACRPKTPRAPEVEKVMGGELEHLGLSHAVRFVGVVADMPALLAETDVLAFPVDDLYGKVDIPLVIIEALSLGVPMVLARGGPLEAVDSARFVDPGDHDGLGREIVRLLDERREHDEGSELYERLFRPERVAEVYDELYESLLRRPLW